MKLINNVISKFKNDSYFRILFELCLSTLLFNVNIYVGLALFAIVLMEILFSKNIENLLYIFAFTFFNDEITIVPWIGGSVSRILMAVIAIKLIIHIIKNRIKPNKIQLGIFLFFAVSCLVNLDNIKAEGIILFNIIIFILFSMALDIKKNQLDKFLFKLFVTIIVGVLCSTLYGIITLNFMEYNQGNKIIYRFSGSYEPNFMCLYLNLSILSLMAIKDKMKNKYYYILFAFLLLFAILTVSFTGIIALSLSFIVYLILFRKNWKTIIKDYVIVAIITALLFGGLRIIKYESIILNYRVNNNIIDTDIDINSDSVRRDDDEQKIEIENTKYSDNAVLDRIIRSYNLLKIGRIDDLTSGRTALIRDFTRESFGRPVVNILFGNNPTNKQVFSTFFDHDCYSHNSYLDFLYNFGVVGFLLIMYFMFHKVFRNIFVNTDIKKSIYGLNIKSIRIMLLLYIFTLSMYTHRILLLFFML